MKKKDGFPGQISYVMPEKIIKLMREDLMISDLYLTDIGYYPKARNHFRERPLGCPQYILIYCVEGKGEISFNDMYHVLPADHFFIVPAGTPHSYHSDKQDPWSIYWIHFSGIKAGLFSKFAGMPTIVDRGQFSRLSDRFQLFSDIFRNLDRGFSVETLEYVNLCLSYLLASFTHLAQFREIRQADEKDAVALSINFMLNNLDRKLMLDEISAKTGLSSSHFSRLFQSRTGHSPIEYFNQLKVQRACRLLDNRDWSIADVSREAGFNDPFYFSRLFHKVMSMSPLDYRKRRG